MHTDANEIAGLFEEIFARDLTNAERICQSCRTRNLIGAHRLYRGAGLVLRCPTCGEPAAAFVSVRDGHAISLHGSWLLA
jgi:hypothetical protein